MQKTIQGLEEFWEGPEAEFRGAKGSWRRFATGEGYMLVDTNAMGDVHADKQ